MSRPCEWVAKVGDHGTRGPDLSESRGERSNNSMKLMAPRAAANAARQTASGKPCAYRERDREL